MSEDKARRFPIPHPGVLLLTGLLLMVIIVGLSVWVPYHREQVAIREIKPLGGTVHVVQVGPDWLLDLVGDEWMKCFKRVDFINFSGEPISNDSLKYLSGLANLKGVSLDRTQVSDDGLKHLNALVNLGNLILSGTEISDDGVKHLKSLTNLWILALSDTRVTDEGLKHLGGFAKLKELRLTGTRVTTQGVKSLQQQLPDCWIIER